MNEKTATTKGLTQNNTQPNRQQQRAAFDIQHRRSAFAAGTGVHAPAPTLFCQYRPEQNKDKTRCVELSAEQSVCGRENFGQLVRVAITK
jgi:hypothetical protein